jgi:hypothetical protein
MRTIGIAFAAVCALIATAGCVAEDMTYTETIVASGKVGTTNFTNELVTLTATGDTSGIFESSTSPVIYQLPVTMTFSVAGGGPSGTFTGSPDVFVNNSFGSAGFSVGADILDVYNSAFATYNLADPLAEVSGSAVDTGYTFGTTDGILQLARANSAGTATFAASVTSATPEPGSLFLLGTALPGFATALWRRNRRTSRKLE